MSAIPSEPLSAAILSAEAAAFRTAAYREAVVAAAALIAHADGEVAPEERSRFLALMRDEPSLAALPTDAVAEDFAIHEAHYRLDPEVAIELAYEKLDAMRGRPRLASAIVILCRALIPADGIGHPSEYRTLADIRSRLGLTARPVPLAGFGHAAPSMAASSIPGR